MDWTCSQNDERGTMEWTGHVVRMIREGQLRKYLRVNRREVDEGEDQD